MTTFWQVQRLGLHQLHVQTVRGLDATRAAGDGHCPSDGQAHAGTTIVTRL